MRRKVPARYRVIEERAVITMALKTEDEVEAKYRSDVAWQSMLAGWEAILCDDEQKVAELHFESVRLNAQRLGFRYIPAADVARLPIEELLARIEVAEKTDRDSRSARAEAVSAETTVAASRARGKTRTEAKARNTAKAAREKVGRAKTDIDSALGLIDVPEIMISDIPAECERVQADKLISFNFIELCEQNRVFTNERLLHFSSFPRVSPARLAAVAVDG